MRKALIIITALAILFSLTGCIIIPIEPNVELTHGRDKIESIKIYEIPEDIEIAERWGRPTVESFEEYYKEHDGGYVFVENIPTQYKAVATVSEEDYDAFVEELISLPFEDYFIIVLAAMDPSYHYSRELVFITYDDGSADVFSAEGQCFGLKDNESLERSFQCDEAIFHEFLTKYTEQ